VQVVLRGTPVVGPWAELGSEAVEVAQRRLYGGNVVEEHPGVDCCGNVVAEYAACLVFAARLKEEAVKPATLAGKRRDLGEFQTWLLQYTPRTLLTFKPADFEAYLISWVRAHGQKGDPPCASTLRKMISNLRGEVSLLSREGAWTTAGTGACLAKAGLLTNRV
jgi:hypothetical protein